MAIGMIFYSPSHSSDSEKSNSNTEVQTTVETKEEPKAEPNPTIDDVKWNMNLEDQTALTENAKICIKLMKNQDNIASNAQEVLASDVLKNPEQYMGKVLKFVPAVVEVENFSSDANAGKLMGGKGHVIMAIDYGIPMMIIKKGDKNPSSGNPGSEITVVGMFAGIQDFEDMGKGLVIFCSPK